MSRNRRRGTRARRGGSASCRAASLVALVPLLALSACETTVGGVRSAAPLETELTRCHVPGLGITALCTEFEVPEDRGAEDGRRIQLRVVVVPARTAQPAPDPVFLFAGGPGQSIIEVGPPIVRALGEVRRERAFVLVEQRGTGEDNPMRCEEEGEEPTLADYFRSTPLTAEEVEECLAALEGADPRHYTSAAHADDVDAVRAALGYERINLWGASYGTRAALVYMRRHPDTVRTAVLDGVAPVAMPIGLPAARDAQRALERMFEACAADEACAEAFPDPGGELRRLLDALERRPARVTVPHPRTGEPAEIEITGDVFAGGLRGLLYSPEATSLIPLLVREAAAGDYRGFVASVVSFADQAGATISAGLMLSVACAEDVPRYDDDGLRRGADTFLGDAMARSFRDNCALWPHAELPPGFAEPVRSDVPVLLLSGENDPITPPAWAEGAASHLPRSRQLVVPGAAHGVSTIGCVPGLIADFVAAGDTSGLEPECVERRGRPPFFLDFAGPEA